MTVSNQKHLNLKQVKLQMIHREKIKNFLNRPISFECTLPKGLLQRIHLPKPVAMSMYLNLG